MLAKASAPQIRAPNAGKATHNGLSDVGITPVRTSTKNTTKATVSPVVCQPLALRISSHFGSAGFMIVDNPYTLINGHYEGSATGETFNASGKTDILIRAENKNVFIAECKFWKGPKSFDDAITQLLGYLSWRDTKTALLVFNKTKNSTEVRKKMHAAIESRSEHRKTVSHEEEGDSRYVFAKPDEDTELIITTQVYDVPDTQSDGG